MVTAASTPVTVRATVIVVAVDVMGLAPAVVLLGHQGHAVHAPRDLDIEVAMATDREALQLVLMAPIARAAPHATQIGPLLLLTFTVAHRGIPPAGHVQPVVEAVAAAAVAAAAVAGS
jgi:hypothetical protein